MVYGNVQQNQAFYPNYSPAAPVPFYQSYQSPYQAYQAQQNPQTQTGGSLSIQNFGTVDPIFANVANPQGFSAIDRDKIKRNAAEFSAETKESIEENWTTTLLKNQFGIDLNNKKKTLISLGLTILTVVGLAILGNSKFSVHKLPELGQKVDDFLLGNGAYKAARKSFNNAKTGTCNFLKKSKTFQDIFNTFKTNKAKPVCNLARGTGQGLKPIFANTPPEIMSKALSKFGEDKAAKIGALEKLVGKGNGSGLMSVLDNADSIRSNQEICQEILNAVSKNFGCLKADGKTIDPKKLNEILKQIESGTIKGLDGKLNIDVADFTKLDMNGGGLGAIISSWWPVNFVNFLGKKFADTSLGKKVFKSGWQDFCRGNLGNSLIKYGVISNNLAETPFGAALQKSLLIPTEQISNFVNDKSGWGFFLCGNIMNLYNNVQDAPDEKKIPTVANDFANSIGNITITMPLACSAVYGFATLGNLKGDTIFSTLLKPAGKFFGMGLGKKVDLGIASAFAKGGILGAVSALPRALLKMPAKLLNSVIGFAGGAMRLFLILYVLGDLFGKPLNAAVNKIFGKPYNKEEEEAEKAKKEQEEALKNINMTQEEMIAKLNAHPEVVQAIQSNPKLLKEIQANPALLLQIVASLDDDPKQQAPAGQSQLLQSYISRFQNPQLNQAPNQTGPNSLPMQPYSPYQPQNPYYINSWPVMQPQAPAQSNPLEPQRTYIPSSRPFVANNVSPDKITPESATNPNVKVMLKRSQELENRVSGLY